MSDDLKDGLVLLKVIDSVVPGVVQWNKVNSKKPLNAYQQIENCNQVVQVAQVGVSQTEKLDRVAN